MSRRLKNSQGYALLITVIVLLLFSILGISLMGAVLAGAVQNVNTEENVQVREVALKGTEYVSAKIYNEINQFLKNAGDDGLEVSELESRFEALMKNHYLKKTIDVDGETGTAKTKVLSYTTKPLTITLESEGIVGNKHHVITQTIHFPTISDEIKVLQYALGAHKSCTSKCSGGEGNLYLHGGIRVEGNINVDNNIIATDHGYAYLGGDQWIPSVKPHLSNGTVPAQIVLGGDIYSFNPGKTDEKNNKDFTYDKHIKRDSFTDQKYINKTNSLKEVFDYPANKEPVITKKTVEKTDIKIADTIKSFRTSYPGSSKNIEGTSLGGTNYYIHEANYPNDAVKFAHIAEYFSFFPPYSYYVTHYDGNYYLKGNYSFSELYTDGAVYVQKKNDGNPSTLTVTNGAYIKKDFIIGNGSSSYDVSKYDKVQIEGAYYIDGDVTIKGADAKFNAIMYVDGDVTIQYSRIQGLKKGNKEGTLIIFATGDIKINNMNVSMAPPQPISEIKGFFYSHNMIEIYGSGSYVVIEGGLSSSKIVLNGIRGQSFESSYKQNTMFYEVKSGGTYHYFENQTNQLAMGPDRSRLQIIYDKDLVETYSNIKASNKTVVKEVGYPQITDQN